MVMATVTATENMENIMEKNNRIVDTVPFMAEMRKLIEAGYGVSLTVTGGSMLPFIAGERDKVYFGPIEKPLKRGDIVFYQRCGGGYVMHRIYRVSREQEYYLVGDAQEQMEGPILREQIFAVVTSVQRKGKWINSGNFVWKFYQYVWIRMVPVRRSIIEIYKTVQRRRKHE